MVVPPTESWAVLTSALEGAVAVDEGDGVAVEAVGGAVGVVGPGEAPGFASAVVGVGVEEALGFVPPHAATDNAMRMRAATQPEDLRNRVIRLILLLLLLLKFLARAPVSLFFRVWSRGWQDGSEETDDDHGNASAEQDAPVSGIQPVPQLFSDI